MLGAWRFQKRLILGRLLTSSLTIRNPSTLIRMIRSWPCVIAHADMDAFYAAVEQLDDPSLPAARCWSDPIAIAELCLRPVMKPALMGFSR